MYLSRGENGTSDDTRFGEARRFDAQIFFQKSKSTRALPAFLNILKKSDFKKQKNLVSKKLRSFFLLNFARVGGIVSFFLNFKKKNVR
jgi:hypothetical protein